MVEFEPDTIVRRRLTGEFAKLLRRCFCGDGKTPVHYEVLIEDKQEGHFTTTIMHHADLELECEPKNTLIECYS